MANLFRKKYPQKNAISLKENWSISKGSHQGNLLLIRFNTDAKRIIGHPDYQHQVGIVIPINSPTEIGLPDNAESVDLNKIEDLLVNQLQENNESLLVAVITTSGVREFVLYTSDPQNLKEKFDLIKEFVQTHEPQIIIQPDEKWEIYKQLSN